MNIESQHVLVIKNCIRKFLPEAKIFLFGSRAKETNYEFSDVDIAIKDPKINFAILAQIRFELEESDLPYKLDLVNYDELDEKILFNKIEL